MRSLMCSMAISLAVSGVAAAAHAEDGPPAEDQAPASETSSAKESEPVQASPEVQQQVGVGTEKEAAQEDEKPKPEDPATPFDAGSGAAEEDVGHAMQFGFRPGLVVPYRVIFRFEDSPQCDLDGDGEGDLNNDGQPAKTCGFVMAPQLEFALSFTPLDSVEPYVWGRFGTGEETETGTEAALLFGAGLRLYTMSASRLKLFFDVAAGLEIEGPINPASAATMNYGTQGFGRIGFGPQFDFNRYFGAFLVLGPGFAVPRGISMQIEGMVGVQGRVP
jgi:hypothetical protein